MRLQRVQIKKFSWDSMRSACEIHHKIAKFTSVYGLGDAQKSTMHSLERYLAEKSLPQAAHGLDNVHQTIRIYLAETFLKLVAEQPKTHRFYYHRFLELLEHYQSADPMFCMDTDFDEIVREPLEKHTQNSAWSYSHPEFT